MQQIQLLNPLKDSLNKKTISQKTYFNYAKKQKLIVELPTDIEKLRSVDPDIRCWSKEEVEYFLSEIKDSPIYTPVLIEVFTGLRVGELCAITWKDFNLDEGWLVVDKQIIRDNLNKKLIVTSRLKTELSKRKISIPHILIDYLKELKKFRRPSDKDLIIHNGDGAIINPRNLSMVFTRAVSKYRNPIEIVKMKNPNRDVRNYRQLKQISFHGLRHTHATILISYKENVKTVSNRLGHKDIRETLNTYTHITNNMKKETADLLDDIFC